MSTPASVPQTTLLPMPDDGVEFELTLNPVVSPLKMVENDGYATKGWKHQGQVITEPQTARFKFVAVGYQPNLEAVRVALATHGKVPEGQWREAVKATFQPDGQHPRGIADASWEHPDGDARFPCVHGDGDSVFGWTDDVYFGLWRWLVEVPKASK